jgi:protoporphyrin/coproporphyrin ferrochelatase
VVTHDAVLLVSFGGPEGEADVLPFLENVTRGRGVPPERLREVGKHYYQFGGVSPINGQNRRLLTAMRAEFAKTGLELPVYWGNRNWTPYLSETLGEMRRDGVRHVLAFFTSAYSSYSGCRQYRENLADALDEIGGDALEIDRIGPYFNHPGFVEPFVDATLSAIDELPEEERDTARILFTTHSIPVSMADTSGVPGGAYVRQHLSVAKLVADGVARYSGTAHEWDLVYQSRSGPPHIPWLEPDISDRLTELAHVGTRAVVVVPIGFVSDHMEVVWDLDAEAAARAHELGLSMVRASTPGDDSRFVSMIADLVRERTEGVPQELRPRLGEAGAAPDRCAPGCCANSRGERNAIGGSD